MIVQKMAGRLQASLEEGMKDVAIWKDREPALLWALFIGAVVTRGRSPRRRAWFLLILRLPDTPLNAKRGLSLRHTCAAWFGMMCWDRRF